jgi:hypothetical protein
MVRGKHLTRWAPVLLALLLPCLAAAQPARNQVYALEGSTARVPVPADETWEVRHEDGRVLRPTGPADPDGVLRLPPGGWYQLFRGGVPFGGRFAAGHVVLVTGQSQAAGLFDATYPRVGAHPAEPDDPPAPPVSALLEGCFGRPDCPPEGTRWVAPGEALGARTLLAELARLRPGIPFALADAARGNAGIADLLDVARPADGYLAVVARAAAPASALLVLAHGTTDANRGTPPEAYIVGVGELVGLLREAGGNPAMPALQAPLSPLRDGYSLLGSGRLAEWFELAPDREGWLFAFGLARLRPVVPATAAHAAVIRAAQAEAARRYGLLPGGEMADVETGADGIHWSAEGLRRAMREAAAALDAALPPS